MKYIYQFIVIHLISWLKHCSMCLYSYKISHWDIVGWGVLLQKLKIDFSLTTIRSLHSHFLAIGSLVS